MNPSQDSEWIRCPEHQRSGTTPSAPALANCGTTSRRIPPSTKISTSRRNLSRSCSRASTRPNTRGSGPASFIPILRAHQKNPSKQAHGKEPSSIAESSGSTSTGRAPDAFDAPQRCPHVAAKIDVDGHARRTRLDAALDPVVCCVVMRWTSSGVSATGAHRCDKVQTEKDVWNHVAIHHVDMKLIGVPSKRIDCISQRHEVGRPNGTRGFHLDRYFQYITISCYL